MHVASPNEYKEFRNTIKEVLSSAEEPMTWTEIKKKAKLKQKVPNNVWVRKMEKDIGLVRERSPKGTIWRLE
ncbi:hypothetical protein AKJ45_00935 [candidate division MSBL1 archaeon SCGC-AAA261F19]|uniref:Restriction system protein Mrr-like N-terminal domain-containing protein n=2 Tax=candidate division MSBL1 TaxID=215777 RepID=A0A133VB39_9EURY|nr:hypothetical protein AKJ43_02855 [candidate division MSBL1 archaeon SCGC-AAA261D19]KXB03662.1 hypothetical protein AKJ45_00935 [candidate division MSBL1 archaeon SCGC-AAA261F19]